MMWCQRIRATLAPERAGGVHVFELTRAQHLAAHQPRVADPADDGQREQDVDEARPQHGDERDRQQQSRERQQRIGHPANRIVNRSAEVAGD